MRAPSQILVVRHGARMDAADANWHLTSPAPYDPPLTYGGWNQAKALGSRIATILSGRARQNSIKAEQAATDGAPLKKKTQKVVIHTSPFLRCVQTSVAIGAGMAQLLEIPEQRMRRSISGRRKSASPDSLHDKKEFSVKALELATPDQTKIKTVLRVDAFLGEWLSPDYFEKITPPPNSTLMVAAAKANLLRKEQIEVFKPNNYGSGYFPGGWSMAGSRRNTSVAPDVIVEEDTSVDTLSLMVPLRPQRSNSANSSSDRSAHVKHVYSSLRPSKAAYEAPIPAYAIAPSDPIPRGYCVHARDSCTDLDLLWDSMRLPQDWGDGGELGEEWSAMHRRFRRGLSKLVDWYSHHTPEFHPDREDPLALDHEETDDEEDDYDLTVILVTHAAGCNALVGALTSQPVLHDFGLTSLSMAVRKEVDPPSRGKSSSPVNGHSRSPTSRRRTSVQLGLADDYDMQIMSSTDHLRAGARATQASALESPHLVPKIPAYSSLPHHSKPQTSPKDRRRSINSSLGSVRRPSLTPTVTATATPSSNDSFSPRTMSPTTSSTGLWSRGSTMSSSASATIANEDMPALSIGAPAQKQPVVTAPIARPSSPLEQAAKLEEDEVPPLPPAIPNRTMSQRGRLWSGQGGDRDVRGMRPKRRWTITERDEFE